MEIISALREILLSESNNKQGVRWLVALIFLFAFVTYIVFCYYPYFIEFFSIPYWSTNVYYSGIYRGSLFLLSISLVIFIWLRIRQFPYIRKNATGIYFVPYFQSSGGVELIMKAFKSDLEDALDSEVEVKILSGRFFYEKLSKIYKDIEEKKSVNIHHGLLHSLKKKFNVDYIILFECIERDNATILEGKKMRELLTHTSLPYFANEIYINSKTLLFPKNFLIDYSTERNDINGLVSGLSTHINYIKLVVSYLKNDFETTITFGNNLLSNLGCSSVKKGIIKIIWASSIHLIETQTNLMYKKRELDSATIDKLIYFSTLSLKHWVSYEVMLNMVLLTFLRDLNTTNSKHILKKSYGYANIAIGKKIGELHELFHYLWNEQYFKVISSIKAINWTEYAGGAVTNIDGFNNLILEKFPHRMDLHFWTAIYFLKIQNNYFMYLYYKKIFLRSSSQSNHSILKSYIIGLKPSKPEYRKYMYFILQHPVISWKIFKN